MHILDFHINDTQKRRMVLYISHQMIQIYFSFSDPLYSEDYKELFRELAMFIMLIRSNT